MMPWPRSAGSQAQERAAPSKRIMVTGRQLAASQIHNAPSPPAVASREPSGENRASRTVWLWPVSVATGSPSSSRQMRTVWSAPAVASSRLSGAKSAPSTVSRWPESVRWQTRAVVHSRTRRSSPPVAIQRPSGLTAQATAIPTCAGRAADSGRTLIASQRCRVPSAQLAAIQVPLGATANALISVVAVIVESTAPVAGSTRRRAARLPGTTTQDPFGAAPAPRIMST